LRRFFTPQPHVITVRGKISKVLVKSTSFNSFVEAQETALAKIR
jgi:hypothetical protein